MYCSKCGSKVEGEGKFCPNCGGALDGGAAPVAAAPVAANPTVVNPAPKKKKSVLPIILICLGVFFLLMIIGIIAAVFLVFKAVDSTTNKLECTSKEGNITINYSDSEIIGYTSSGITYDLDGQKEIAKKVGVPEYLEQFNEWFEKNTTGTCVKKNAQGEVIGDFKGGNGGGTTTKPTTPTTTGTKVVGQDTYGYVEVPKDWVNFQDINGGHSIQFSYGTTYIVTLDYVSGWTGTAKDAANNFYAKQTADTSVTDIKTNTGTIGKSKKYNTYEISMYYPTENVYLYTYWFDAEDGNLHYIALEGPKDLDKYIDVVESFSLTK